MNRRGFLALLAGTAGALALGPIEATYAQVLQAEPEIASFHDILSELTAELLRVYPPGFFDDVVHRESLFYRLLKETP